MLNTLSNDKNINRILELIKYPLPHYLFILCHTRIKRVVLITQESGFISCYSVQYYVCNGIGSRN